MSESAVVSRRAQRPSAPTKGDRQERALLDAAAQVLAQGQAAAASVGDLAGAAGISRASFYFYFASKQALFASVVDETVTTFNASVREVTAAEHEDPAAAVRSTVESAARLWWEHGAVMTSSVTLGTTVPELYDRTMQNIALVREPTVDLLKRYGTVPEASDDVAAAELVTSLILMCERTFYDLMRGNPTENDRDRLVARLGTIWLRAFGIEEHA